jgi:hypothetical protein
MGSQPGSTDWINRVLVCVAAVAIAVLAFVFVRNTHNEPPELKHPPFLELAPEDFGATAVARLVVSNDGGSELVVGPFQTSCSCAGVELEEGGKFRRIDQLRIPARTQAELVVRIGVGVKPGTSQRVHIAFASNDPARPESSFVVTIPRVLGGVYTVSAAAIFGEVNQGAGDVQTVLIYDNGVQSRQIGGVQISHPERFELELVAPKPGIDEPQVHETAGRMIAVAKIRPKPGWVGPLDGYFELAVSGENRSPDRVDVIGQVSGSLECRPDALLLPRFVVGKEEYQGELLISRRDGKAISTVTFDEPPEGVKATVVLDPSDALQAKIVVSCDGTALITTKTVRLRFHVQAGQELPISIDLPLTITKKPS